MRSWAEAMIEGQKGEIAKQPVASATRHAGGEGLAHLLQKIVARGVDASVGRVRPLAWLRRLPLGHHHLALEVADLFAVLIVAIVSTVTMPRSGLLERLLLFEHSRLGVDRVAVKRRFACAERLDLEVGDR